MGATKGLLMCCYSYPPTPDSGVYRSTRFVKHLPDHGWSPVVVTTNVYGNEGVRYGGEGRPHPELVALYHWLAHKSFRRSGRIERNRATLLADPAASSVKDALVEFASRWVAVPDVRLGWIFFAVLPAWRSLRGGETHAVYTSSPPSRPTF